jgi:hypothetical protein
MISVSDIRKDLTSDYNVGGMNAYAVEGIISECEDVCREAWEEVRFMCTAMEAVKDKENYFSDLEGWAADPSEADMEGAFMDTINKWADAVSAKIKSIMAWIRDALDKQFTKADSSWWDKRASKAFEHASSCKDTMEMLSWNWDASSGSKLEGEMKAYTDKFQAAVDAFDKAEGDKDKKGSVAGDTSTEGGKVDDQLAKLFLKGGKINKTVKVRLSDLNENKLHELFVEARADRKFLTTANDELKKMEKTVQKMKTSNFDDAARSGLGTLKKNLNKALEYTRKGAGLIMQRRRNIKSAVAKLAAHSAKKERDEKNKD